MFLAIKIILTIILVVFTIFCASFIIEELKYYKNWTRAILTAVLMVMGPIDIWIIWFT